LYRDSEADNFQDLVIFPCRQIHLWQNCYEDPISS